MSLSKLQKIVKDREAWRVAIHGVAKSRTRPSDWTETERYYHRIGGLWRAHTYFSHIWKLGSPRSGWMHIQCLVRSCFLIHRHLPSHCNFTWQKGQGSSLGSLCCLVPNLCCILCDSMDCSMQSPLSFAISQGLLKLMSIESVMSSNHLILYCPFSFCPQSFPASGSFLRIRWPNHWSFSFSISPSNAYSGLISFRMD